VPHNLVASFFGQKGSGKSTLVREIMLDRERVFFVDTVGEARAADGFEIVFGFEPCVNAMLAAAKRERFRLALRCQHTDDMLKLCTMAYEVPRQLTVVEETSFYCSPSYLPPELSTLIRYGRHREIDQFYVARRPSEIHRDLTANSDLVVSFHQHEPRDVAYLRAIGGPQAEAVRALPKYRVLAWGDLERAPLAVISRLDTALVAGPVSGVSEQETPQA